MKALKITLTALIAVLTVLIFSCNSGKKQVNQASQHLRIMSYNVWYGFSEVPEGKKTWILSDHLPVLRKQLELLSFNLSTLE